MRRTKRKNNMKTLITMLLLLGSSAVVAAQAVPADHNPLLRRYREGETLTYQMEATNDGRRYQAQADGIVKKASDGTYYEEYQWSNLVLSGKPSPLTPTGVNFVQQVTLDPNHHVSFPNLSQADPRLIGPALDLLTFYTDLWLVEKTGKLQRAGDHFYFKRSTPNSWADGHYVLLGEDSIDFDLTLKDINPSDNTATLLVQHVPPPQPEVRYAAEWMRKPVADTPNNWVQIEKTKDGKYLAAMGKETFDVVMTLSLSDGKILSATMDNPVHTMERECSDAALTECGESKSHVIKREIEISLQH